jgi:hypothetical protein
MVRGAIACGDNNASTVATASLASQPRKTPVDELTRGRFDREDAPAVADDRRLDETVRRTPGDKLPRADGKVLGRAVRRR